MDEQTRLQHCQDIAERMYLTGMGWQYDVLERFTRPQIDMRKIFQAFANQKQTIMRRKINKYFKQRG